MTGNLLAAHMKYIRNVYKVYADRFEIRDNLEDLG